MGEYTRRYRIYVAAVDGRRHRIYEFSLWIQEMWREFAQHLGVDCSGPWYSTASNAVFMMLGLDEGQLAFDDWIEERFSIATQDQADAALIRTEY